MVPGKLLVPGRRTLQLLVSWQREVQAAARDVRLAAAGISSPEVHTMKKFAFN